MDILMIILRLTHVLSGVFWAGATFVLASHVTPAVAATGTEGQKFMQHLAGKGKISNALGITGILAMVSGWWMYFGQSWQLQYNSANGVVLGLGAIMGTLAFFHGAFVQRKATTELSAMGMQIASSGGPPTPDQAAAMGRLAGKVTRNGQILAYILALTVAAMASFQYF
jgi:hypothetical protein